MDITPLIPKNKKQIRSYGKNSFTVGDEEFNSNIIISPDSVTIWPEKSFETITERSFDLLSDRTELLLIGCGKKHLPLPANIQVYFAEKNIAVDIMTTNAACRTYNILLAEGRNVSAALIIL